MSETAKQITKKSKSSFYWALRLLPAPKRDALHTVYAFCRKSDDIVDQSDVSDEIKFTKLTAWLAEFEDAFRNESQYTLLNKVAAIIEKFHIPMEPFFDLLKGMEMDLFNKRYNTFEELRLYCYRVASTVGLMSISIFGYKHESAIQYAVNLGIAMQLTNIIRDVAKDAKLGRIYLPLEDLQRFGVSEDDLLNGVYNARFINLMEFQANRAIEFYALADNALHQQNRRTLFAARAMQHIYFRILRRIINNKYDVFNKTIKLAKIEKFGIAFGVWAKYSLKYR